MINQFYTPLHNIKISPIVKISEKSKIVEKDFENKTGEKFIHLERGELNLNTPNLLLENIKKSLENGKTKYPKSGGEILFKEKISEKLVKKNNISKATKDDIVVTAGGQEALNMSFQLFAYNIGCGFSPIWSVALENFVPYSHINFLEIPLNEDYQINWNLLESTLKKSKFLYLNNPQNPTGKIFKYDELYKIIELCKKYNIFVISDEAYEDIIYDDNKYISASRVAEELDHVDVISCFTFSKSYASTGIRVGYVYSKNLTVIKLLNAAQYTHTAGIPTFLQYGLCDFMNIDLSDNLKEFQQRRDLFYNGLENIKGMKLYKPEGAFYLYPNVTNGMKKYPNKDILDLLMENGICVVPGWGFTKNNHFINNIRISFSSVNQEDIKIAIKRFQNIF